MALYYNLVFGLLVIEMAFFTVLSLPFPRAMRKSVLKTVSAPFRSEQFLVAIKCILCFVLVLFVDSLNRVYTVTAELHALSPTAHTTLSIMNDKADVQARRFYAQRNMYLCGFTLFLTLILTRTYSLVAELIDTKDKLDDFSKNQELGSEGNAGLNKTLQERDEQLAAMKEQAAALSTDYDSTVKSRKKKA